MKGVRPRRAGSSDSPDNRGLHARRGLFIACGRWDAACQVARPLFLQLPLSTCPRNVCQGAAWHLEIVTPLSKTLHLPRALRRRQRAGGLTFFMAGPEKIEFFGVEVHRYREPGVGRVLRADD